MATETQKQFYLEVEKVIPDDYRTQFYWFATDATDEIVLDGRFSLECLRVLVAAWEKLNTNDQQ